MQNTAISKSLAVPLDVHQSSFQELVTFLTKRFYKFHEIKHCLEMS